MGKDKVDYILKNFEDILEIYVIIEKKDMEKMKKNIQELHLKRRELRKDLGLDCAYTPTTPNSKSKFTFDFDEKRLQTEVEMLEEKKAKKLETQLCQDQGGQDCSTLELSEKSSEFFTPFVSPSAIPKISVSSPMASPIPDNSRKENVR